MGFFKKGPEDYNEKGRIEEKNKNWNCALSWYFEALKLDPSNEDACLRIGMVYSSMKNASEAERWLRSYLQLHPNNSLVRHKLAQVLLFSKRDKEAETELRAVLTSDPKNATVHYELAGILEENKKYQEAEEELRKALSIISETKIHLYSFLVDKYLNLFETLQIIRSDLGKVLLQLGKSDEAEKEFLAAIQINPEEKVSIGHIRYFLGNLYLEKNRLKEAEEQYRESLKIEPESKECHVKLAEVLEKLGQTDNAGKERKTVNNLPSEEAKMRLGLGLSLYENREYVAAENMFREALKISPDYPRAHILLGSTLMALGRFEDAGKCYYKALELDPSDPSGHIANGDLLMHFGKFVEAETEFKYVVSLDPNNPRSHESLARLYYRLNRQNDAFIEAGEAGRLSFATGMKHLDSGDALLVAKKKDEARKEYIISRQLFNEIMQNDILKMDPTIVSQASDGWIIAQFYLQFVGSTMDYGAIQEFERRYPTRTDFGRSRIGAAKLKLAFTHKFK